MQCYIHLCYDQIVYTATLFYRSHSGGDEHNRRDRKKGKQKRRGPDSPDDVSPSKKNKRLR